MPPRIKTWGAYAHKNPFLTTAVLKPSWSNRHTGEQAIATRLDRFLNNEGMLVSAYCIKKWIGTGGGSDHSPVFWKLLGI